MKIYLLSCDVKVNGNVKQKQNILAEREIERESTKKQPNSIKRINSYYTAVDFPFLPRGGGDGGGSYGLKDSCSQILDFHFNNELDIIQFHLPQFSKWYENLFPLELFGEDFSMYSHDQNDLGLQCKFSE